MGLSVAKFGGSSLSTEQKVRWAAKVVAADEDRRITVVSAAGTSEEHQIKLTDDCYSLAAESDTVLMTQKTGAIIERYQAIYPDQKMDKIKKDLESRLGVSFPTRALRTEAIAAWGDEAQAKLFAELTGRTYVDPANFLRVAEVRGRIVVLPKSYDMMQTYFREGEFVAPGFSGRTEDGIIRTLGRSGSDRSQMEIGAGLSAEVCENFTDQLGVFTADPRIIEQASLIPVITYDEMRDLALGAGVIHAQALHPVKKKGIPVHVRSASETNRQGTLIVYDRQVDPERPVVGVSYKSGYCSVDVSQDGMNDAVGVFADVAGVFKQQGISIEFPPAGIDDFSMVFHQDQRKGPEAVNDLYRALARDGLLEMDDIAFQENLACVVVAGKGLKGRRGTLAEIMGKLRDEQINVRFVSQGPKERCIVVGTNADKGVQAFKALHALYLE